MPSKSVTISVSVSVLPWSSRRIGFDPQERPRVFVGQQIEQSVGTLPHITESLVEILEQPFTAAHVPLVVEGDSLQTLGQP